MVRDSTLRCVLPDASADSTETAAMPIPLFDRAATRALEAAAQARAPQPPLMARAGFALARLVRAIAPHACRTWVLAGPGNNGGDGLVAARWLHTGRHDVQVRLVGDPARLPGDARLALRAALAAGVPVRAFDPDEDPLLGPQDLLLDALLGLGASRSPEGELAQAIAAANASRAARGTRVLAADLPSGLHPDTGALLGTQAVRADVTLALLSIKPGCVTADGRLHAGALWWDDLGVSLPCAGTQAGAEAQTVQPTAWLLASPRPPTPPHEAVVNPGTGRPQRTRDRHEGHKGSFGDVWVLGGAPGMEGALALAASAALSAGAGRVHAVALSAQAAPWLAARPELMQRAPDSAFVSDAFVQGVWVAGCGGGAAVASHLPRLLAEARRLVLDADALNAVAAQPALQQAVAARSGMGLQTVLTPHPLEAARLLGTSSMAVQADRWAAARQLAQRYGAVVLLKGSGTVVCTPGGPPWVNGSGNAALATAGTGDVLAGWLAGCWAQSTSRQAPRAARQLGTSTAAADGTEAMAAISRAAAWQHGCAADAWQRADHHGPLLAADLIAALRELDDSRVQPVASTP